MNHDAKIRPLTLCVLAALALTPLLTLGLETSAWADDDDEDRAEHRQELDALARTTLSLSDAIRAARKSVDGEVYEASFELDEGRASYEITLSQGGHEIEVHVDPADGAILSKRDEGKTRSRPKLDPIVALRVALLHTPGRALEIDCDVSTPGVACEVTVARGHRSFEVRVAPDGSLRDAHEVFDEE